MQNFSPETGLLLDAAPENPKRIAGGGREICIVRLDRASQRLPISVHLVNLAMQ